MQEDWLMKAMAAERAGQSMPPLPTQRVGVRSPGDADYVTPIGGQQPAANMGRQVLAPAYVDPRSQAIAQTPALIRPAHSMLDKLFRPGRADAANQMNREYLENALKSQMARSGQRTEQQYNQARGRSTTADAAIKELQLRAMSGDDPEALESLKEYYKAEALRRGGGPSDMYQRILASRGEGGEQPVDPETGMIPTRREGAGDDTAPPENPYMNMTRDAAIKAFSNASKEIDSYIARYESIAAGEGRARRGRWENLTGIFSGQDSVETSPNEIQDAVDRVERGKDSKKILEEQIKEAHNWSPANLGGLPLTSPVGGPTIMTPE
jgi:hypothetical protein